MKTTVISTAPFVKKADGYYAYSPYLAEMELWAKHSGDIAFLCPVRSDGSNLLLSKVNFAISKIYEAKEFDLKTAGGIFRGIFYSIYNFLLLFRAMHAAGHIHLRCPGNISLMGCIVQIFFPKKPKSTKYAGNWDPKADQPLSYRLQKWILNNSFLTRNMSVMAYGRWDGASKNIKPFFTATYRESDKMQVAGRSFDGTIRFLFVGTLSPGKRPLYACRLVEELHRSGIDVSLDFFGEGTERMAVEAHIQNNDLGNVIQLRGNQPQEVVREAYKSSHFLVLASKSEGWPKAVAEGMFWGCVPLSTRISCVPFMLDQGNRGILLDLDLEEDASKIKKVLLDPKQYDRMSLAAAEWSQQYTLEVFENKIKHLLTS